MSYALIISEKPAAAKKIAEALADGKIARIGDKTTPAYQFTHNNKEIIIAPAVGHLYGLAEKEKKGYSYPVFEIEWKPLSEISKSALFSKKYLDALKKYAKEANEYYVSTDKDVEGELLGWNILKFACKQKNAKRMEFSTLTKPDLVRAFENPKPTVDSPLIEAGETRHYLDYYYGINLSRALMSAIKKAGTFKILSSGRVQGPALKIIVEREKEIKAFKPTPYWQLQMTGEYQTTEFEAFHEADKIWEQKKAEEIHSKIKNEKTAIITSVQREQYQQAPPTPFDLTTLQTEAYKCLGISPKMTSDIAQNLYTQGYISYPRTSSQVLPQSLGFSGILKLLAKQTIYAGLIADLLQTTKGKLEPNNGKKTDPAHPAIFPTGITPKFTDAKPAKLYDLIVKRFLATFSPSATRETLTVKLTAKEEIFIAKGTRTVEKGWHYWYAPYIKLEEATLPAFKEKETVAVKKIDLLAKETTPPKRYTPSSIIKELEKRNLGTKATRAEIVETLYDRNYVAGESVQATDLGIKITEILEKFVPEMIDEEMTRHFELDMEEIQEGKTNKEKVLLEAEEVITKILAKFKTKEKEVGEDLQKTFADTKAFLITVGACPFCKKGNIILRKGKFGRFLACDTYPECKTTIKIPPYGSIKIIDKQCTTCNYPILSVGRKAKSPKEACINPECATKKPLAGTSLEGTICNKCNIGKLVLRKSIYGIFYGCSTFPKCRNIVRAEAGGVPVEKKEMILQKTVENTKITETQIQSATQQPQTINTAAHTATPIKFKYTLKTPKSAPIKKMKKK